MASFVYVEIIGPNDAIFVGPFESESALFAWIAERKLDAERSEHFDFYPTTEQDMRASIAEFGAVPIHTPEEME